MFGVRKFPASEDPRTQLFCTTGYAWGAVPPYKFVLSSVGALDEMALFNDGVVLPIVDWTTDYYEAFNPSIGSDLLSVVLHINGFGELQTFPVDHTIRISFAATAPGLDIFGFNHFLNRPPAIAQYVGVPIDVVGLGLNYFPNGLTITPTIWNTPTTP